MSDYITIFCTVPSQEVGEKVADKLVMDTMVACVNIVPGITSVYSWKDEICRDTEQLLIMKTRTERFDMVKEAILSLHPYEVPEIIALPIEAGHKDYLDWITENT